MENKPWISKTEISHEELDKKAVDDPENNSARYKLIGYNRRMELVDKIIYPVNVCPECKSEATFHRRMQQVGKEFSNVWHIERKEDNVSYVTVKYDFCLDCRSPFVFEIYILKIIE